MSLWNKVENSLPSSSDLCLVETEDEHYLLARYGDKDGFMDEKGWFDYRPRKMPPVKRWVLVGDIE